MAEQTDTHKDFMLQALDQAAKARGYTAPNPMVGCLIVKNGQIIASGYHQQTGLNHAEINALGQVSSAICLKDATCYVTLEPCCHYGRTGPCVESIINSGIKKVIIAMTDPNPLVSGKGIELLKKNNIEVILGVCESEARELNKGFISRITKTRPFITSKIAASLDGKVALANGQSKWITNTEAREDVHVMRSYSDAIVTTAATVMADDPMLTSRIEPNPAYGYIKQPMRVVIDPQLLTMPSANIYQQSSGTVIIATDNACLSNSEYSDKIKVFESQGIEIYGISNNSNRLDISQIWQLLAELGCNDVMIEAGGRFNAYLLANNLVDDWVVYQSGLIMGQGAQSMFDLPQQDSMSDLFKLKCKHISQLGDNWKVILSAN